MKIAIFYLSLLEGFLLEFYTRLVYTLFTLAPQPLETSSVSGILSKVHHLVHIESLQIILGVQFVKGKHTFISLDSVQASFLFVSQIHQVSMSGGQVRKFSVC